MVLIMTTTTTMMMMTTTMMMMMAMIMMMMMPTTMMMTNGADINIKISSIMVMMEEMIFIIVIISCIQCAYASKQHSQLMASGYTCFVGCMIKSQTWSDCPFSTKLQRGPSRDKSIEAILPVLSVIVYHRTPLSFPTNGALNE